jgi:SAM-dependent methyltransferase
MGAGFDCRAVFEPEDYLHFYGSLLTEERTSAELDFLTKHLELSKPLRILDLGCGFGRHANLLARQGHEVVGVDCTPGFLERASKQAESLGVQVTYTRGDMRDIHFRGEFDRVIMMFTVFGYFSDEENQKVLRNVAASLAPGGMLCFDTPERDAFLKFFLPYIVHENGEDLMIDINRFDNLTGRVYTRRIIIKDGRRSEKPFFVRLYNQSEIRDLLQLAGLQLSRIYGDLSGHESSYDSRRMIVIAKKPV